MRHLRLHGERGSLPLAMLASIAIAGVITVLVSTVIATERNTRFDRSFKEGIHHADAGVNEAYFWLQQDKVDLAVGGTTAGTTSDGDLTYEWTIERTGALDYEVSSTGEVDGVERTVVAQIVEQALFYPGAFAESLVALNGASSYIDSYESATQTCPSPAEEDRCWGTDPDFGTGNGAAGTNGDFNFAGTDNIKNAILYDWSNYPGTGTTAALPGGHRCDDDYTGSPCRADKLRIVNDGLDYDSEDAMQFIHDKLDTCRDQGRLEPKRTFETGDTIAPHPGTNDTDAESPRDEGWNSYYCYESLEILDDLELDGASTDAPVVIFLEKGVRVPKPRTRVNCPGCKGGNQASNWRDVRPEAPSLQIYSAAEGSGDMDMVTFKSGSIFAGVITAPRTACGGENSNASVHVYGAMICRDLDNVGGWRLHFDDVLAKFGRKVYTVDEWREEVG